MIVLLFLLKRSSNRFKTLFKTMLFCVLQSNYIKWGFKSMFSSESHRASIWSSSQNSTTFRRSTKVFKI